jgi:hypothetical protein
VRIFVSPYDEWEQGRDENVVTLERGNTSLSDNYVMSRIIIYTLHQLLLLLLLLG